MDHSSQETRSTGPATDSMSHHRFTKSAIGAERCGAGPRKASRASINGFSRRPTAAFE
jgi:hypothetical protein